MRQPRIAAQLQLVYCVTSKLSGCSKGIDVSGSCLLNSFNYPFQSTRDDPKSLFDELVIEFELQRTFFCVHFPAP